jgi:hypothetical protein
MVRHGVRSRLPSGFHQESLAFADALDLNRRYVNSLLELRETLGER